MNSNQGLISNFKPDCEVAEEENKYIFKFDLPGVKKEQVHVEVNNDQITVTAERKEEKKHESKRKFFSEFNYGSFTRSFNLPGKLDEKKVDAKFEDGVLTVTVPKSEKSTAKQISIQ